MYSYGLLLSQPIEQSCVRIAIERNMLVAEQFIKSLIRKYGKHNISTDGGT